MMDYQTIFNVGLGSALTALGWFARQLWDAVAKLKDDLASLKEDIAKNYVPKNEFREFALEIRQMFQRISDKLDEKVDK